MRTGIEHGGAVRVGNLCYDENQLRQRMDSKPCSRHPTLNQRGPPGHKSEGGLGSDVLSSLGDIRGCCVYSSVVEDGSRGAASGLC